MKQISEYIRNKEKGGGEMKKMLTIIITTLILIGSNYFLASLLKVQFAEIAFFVGLIATVIIRFFTSSGGYMSKQLDMQIQGHTGIKVDRQERRFTPTVIYYTCLAYTIIAAVLTFIHYKDYFF